MAFSLPLITILVSWISYQTVAAHPFGMNSYGPGVGAGTRAGTSGYGLNGTAVPIKTDLSESCKAAADALSHGKLATCANIPGFIAISKAEGSVVPAIKAWVTGACAAVPCRREVLATAAQKFKNECQKDLEDGSAPALGIYSHLLHYKEARDTICTQLKSDSQFCIPTTMEALESKANAKFTNDGFKAMMAGKVTNEALAFMTVPKEAHCTPCSHALATQSAIMVEAITKDPKIKFEHSTALPKQKVAEICGASFDDHQLPSSVQIAAPGTGKAYATGSKDGGSSGAGDEESDETAAESEKHKYQHSGSHEI
ncbi:hypothetical protein Pst134EA_021189 [Puccinia striiformis f. sp. tritici]|nr:hypothetical protein Pst134EA_021189 [Puccinia striiformis f. sp. tritici]KAH9448035.1 hypothetical protein Pst134EB_022022 [Puccinia striiformis f. sp. tritici]KAH9457306.1 hypothetical protein Pst134EA_021189 [Puccinia striiformis f. sp. tritici]KAI9614783.1 hypothetical protein H4Q26_009176 [Puccinia striiformis f. sp. tritici PST-130]